MSAWEYSTVRHNVAGGHLDTTRLDEELNDMAQNEWEMMAVTPVIYNGETMFLLFSFRRAGEPKRRAGFKV